ncbi:MAG: prepilin-type N-terminal cleavage/methylation domain-containing protein [Verrucomicrobiota bacterium]
MLQKMHSRRGGFTLVEIMIVVAIIGLLAVIALPNFLRARLRSQATSCKLDLKMLDEAIGQYAIENNKKPTDAVAFTDLKCYIKDSSPLYYNGGTDLLGNTIGLTTIAANVRVPAATKTATATVADDTFWSPYQ